MENKKRKVEQPAKAAELAEPANTKLAVTKPIPPLDTIVTSYQKDGYVVLPQVLSLSILQALREECDDLMAKGVDLIEVLHTCNTQRRLLGWVCLRASGHCSR